MARNCINIKSTTDSEFDDIWAIFQQIIRGGDTFVYGSNTSQAVFRDIWFGPDVRTYTRDNSRYGQEKLSERPQRAKTYVRTTSKVLTNPDLEVARVYTAFCDEHIVVGSYILQPNCPDLGSHIANASYMVDPGVQGQGVGRAMGKHSILRAKELGYLAMQLNMVVSTNQAALKLWQSLGFKIIGTVPKAFNHSKLGLVDVHIMYLKLD